MATYAIVDALGSIVNRVVVDDSAWTPADGFTAVAEGDLAFDIGGTYSNGAYTPPMVPPSDGRSVVPQSISDRQFFQQLAVDGIITEEQALASNAAVIPAPLLAIIAQMPEDQQFAAKMVVSGATTFERQHPMTIAIGAAYGMSSEQIDGFFSAAAVL